MRDPVGNELRRDGLALVGRPFVPAGRLVVLFDGACPVCRAIVGQLRRRDGRQRGSRREAAAAPGGRGRLEFLPLQEASSDPRPAIAAAGSLPLAAALHVVDPATGRVAAGGDAVLTIVDRLPGGRILRPWWWSRPFRVVVDAAYRAVAARRDLLARWLGLG